MTTSIALPHKAVIPIPSDDTWDIYLDRQLVASGFTSERAAQLELDLVAFHVLFGEVSLDPHGIATDEAIDLALQIVLRLFQTTTVQQRLERAVREIIRTTSDVPIYTIQLDGSLRVLASHARKGQPRAYQVATTIVPRGAEDDHLPRSYHVRESCDCLDFHNRMHEHGGICKHVAAKLILFLAERGASELKELRDALVESPTANSVPELEDATDAASNNGPLTFVELPPKILAGACFIPFLTEMPVQVEVRGAQLLLRAGQALISVPGSTGCGTSTTTLDAATFARFWHALNPAVKNGLAETTLCIFVDPGGLFVCSSEHAPVFALRAPEPIPVGQGEEGERCANG